MTAELLEAAPRVVGVWLVASLVFVVLFCICAAAPGNRGRHGEDL